MKKILLIVFSLATLFFSCDSIEVHSENNNRYKIRVTNYTDKPYKDSKLFIGAKNSNGNFIATDSVIYSNIPSNISPDDDYLTDDEYYASNNSSSNGYYYFRTNSEQFVKIPFPFYSGGTLKISEEKILNISENIGFLFTLSNGDSGFIEGFNLIDGIDNSSDNKTIYVHIDIKNNEISGKIQLPFSQ